MSQAIYSDKWIFHGEGKLNRYNDRIQVAKNFHQTRKLARGNAIVIVWCAISVKQLVGPYYFDSHIVIVESYKPLLTKYFLSLLPSSPQDAIFLQGGAQPQYILNVRQLPDEKFPHSKMRRQSPTRRAACSPEQTPHHFLYENMPRIRSFLFSAPHRRS